MKIEELKVKCDWIVKNQELCTHTEAQLASALLAGIGEAERLRPYALDEYACGERAANAAVIKAMEDAT